MYIEHPDLADDEPFEDLLVQIRESIDVAVARRDHRRAERLLMGMSAETFWGGVEGNAAFEERIWLGPTGWRSRPVRRRAGRP